MDICTYCGDPASTVDHVPPKRQREFFRGRPDSPPFVTVPACRQCNCVILKGREGLETVEKRKAYVAKRLLSRLYRQPLWSEAELLEMEGNLRAEIRAIAVRRRHLEARIVFANEGAIMPRGGHRPGAGRKPKGQEGNVLTMPDRKVRVQPPIPDLPESDRVALSEAPLGVSEAARALWHQWAPQALAERTLTPATAAGFAQLCQQWAYVTSLAKKIDHLGPDTKEAIPYMIGYLKLAQRLDASLARFKLTAFGKPAVSDKPKAAANPWAQVAGKL